MTSYKTNNWTRGRWITTGQDMGWFWWRSGSIQAFCLPLVLYVWGTDAYYNGRKVARSREDGLLIIGAVFTSKARVDWCPSTLHISDLIFYTQFIATRNTITVTMHQTTYNEEHSSKKSCFNSHIKIHWNYSETQDSSESTKKLSVLLTCCIYWSMTLKKPNFQTLQWWKIQGHSL